MTSAPSLELNLHKTEYPDQSDGDHNAQSFFAPLPVQSFLVLSIIQGVQVRSRFGQLGLGNWVVLLNPKVWFHKRWIFSPRFPIRQFGSRLLPSSSFDPPDCCPSPDKLCGIAFPENNYPKMVSRSLSNP